MACTADQVCDCVSEGSVCVCARRHGVAERSSGWTCTLEAIVSRAPRILVSRQYYHFCLLMIIMNVVMLLWVRHCPFIGEARRAVVAVAGGEYRVTRVDVVSAGIGQSRGVVRDDAAMARCGDPAMRRPL